MAKSKKQRKHRPEAPRTAAAPRGWNWKADGLRALLVLLVTLGAYANSIHNGFAYDDLRAIQDNTRLDDPGDLGTFFGTSYWNWKNDATQLYRPLTVWSWAMDQKLFGPGPYGVHLVNVLAGSLQAALVYVFLLVLFRKRTLALVAALLFALHPVHTEVLANGVGRSEIASGVFLMAAAILHVLGARRARPGPLGTFPSPLYLAGAVLCFMTALLFKESAVVLPALLFLADWLVLEKARFRPALRRLPGILVYAVPVVVYLMLRTSVIGTALPAVQEVMMPLSAGQRVLFASGTLLAYLGQLAVPWRLVCEYSDYRNPIAATLGHPAITLSLVAWIALGYVVFRLARRQAVIPLYGIGWFWIAILPVSNLLFPIGTVRADRLLFIPSLGFVLVLAWLLLALARRRRTVAWALLAVILGFYGWRTVTRNPDWKSQESIWTADLAKNPGSAVGWTLLGDVRRQQGRFDEAEADYRRAFELRDRNWFYPEAHNHYAELMSRKGNVAEAKRHYRLVLSKDPRQTTALINLGAILLNADSTRAESIRLLERAIAVEPDNIAPRVNLTQAYDNSGRLDLALQTIEGAIAIAPRRPDLWTIKGIVLRKAGRTAEADAAAAKARSLGGI